MQKPPACSCVCPASSCTAGRALIRSWATGRGALRWVCTRLSFGEARHATLSSIPPTSNHSLVIHGALAVVVLIVQSSSSGRLRPAEERCDRTVWPRSGPPRVATCRPAQAPARTVWQWHSGGEREERATEGHSVATLHIHTTGHWPQLLSHFTAPAHPPCSARSRPGTVGVICVTDNRLLCASPRLLAFDFSNYAGAHGRPGPAAMRWPRCANRMRDRTDVGRRPCEGPKLDLESDAPPTGRRHVGYINIIFLYRHEKVTKFTTH
jgi:hypothetical protein